MHLLPWLITAYLIASTAVTPLYGKISDIHGRRRTVMAALVIYMAGSLICALAPNLLVLILGRVVHGLGGGGLTSMGMAVLGDLAAPKDRGRYYSYFSATYTTAGACGPALGGFISDYVHWSAIFWLNIPLGIIALRLTSERLRRLPRHERPHRLDVVGAVLIVAASVAFMLGLTLAGSRYPWLSPQVLGLAGAALALGTLFVIRLLTAPEPLIPISILSDPVARCALTANTFGWAPIVGLNVFMPTYLQSVLGLSATTAGLSLMVIMVALNTSAGMTGQVIGRVVHYKRLPDARPRDRDRDVVDHGMERAQLDAVVGRRAARVLGVGFGPVPPVAMVSLQNTVEAHHLGTAVGTLSFLRNLCATIIVSIFGALVLVGSARVLPRGIDGLALPAERFTHVFYLAAVSLVVSLIALLLMEEKPLRSNRPAATGGDAQG